MYCYLALCRYSPKYTNLTNIHILAWVVLQRKCMLLLAAEGFFKWQGSSRVSCRARYTHTGKEWVGHYQVLTFIEINVISGITHFTTIVFSLPNLKLSSFLAERVEILYVRYVWRSYWYTAVHYLRADKIKYFWQINSVSWCQKVSKHIFSEKRT